VRRDAVGEIVVRPAELADEPALIELLDELDRSQAQWRVFEPRPGYREELLARYRAIRADCSRSCGISSRTR